MYELPIEAELMAIGYVRSPNNCERLPSAHYRGPLSGASPIWYAGCPGVPMPVACHRVQVC